MKAQEKKWHRLENFFEKIHLPHLFVAFIISVIIYLIFLIFGYALESNLGLKDHIVAISMGLLIGYQIAAVEYLFNIFGSLLIELSIIFKGFSETKHEVIIKQFFMSHWQYAIIFCFILPFYIIDWIPFSYERIYESFFSFSAIHNKFIVLFFNIFRELIALSAEFLLAFMLWIMINIAFAFRYFVNIAIAAEMDLNALRIKLKMYSIKSLLSKAITLCILSISLAIFSYTDPSNVYSAEIEILLLFIIISLILYFSAIESSQQILRNRITYEIDCISEKNYEQSQKLFAISLADGKENNIARINEISSILNALEKQQDQLKTIFPKKFNFKSFIIAITTLSGSLLIPLITGLFKIIIEKNPEIASKINYIIIEAISNISRT